MNDNFPKFYRTTREQLADPDAFWQVVYEDPDFRREIKKRVLDDKASGDPDRMFWEDVPITRQGEETSFWHWGARRNHTRCLVIGFSVKRSAIIIFTNQANGLEICEGIAQTGLDHPEPFPAFRWLLPADRWRGDGLKD